MIQESEVLYVVPCRANSKRLPKKHMRYINGKRLINFTLDYMIHEGLKEQTCIITDDQDVWNHVAGFNRVQEEKHEHESTIRAMWEAYRTYQQNRFGAIALVIPDIIFRPPGLFSKLLEALNNNTPMAAFATFAEPPFNPTSLLEKTGYSYRSVLGGGYTQQFKYKFISWAGCLWNIEAFDPEDLTLKAMYQHPAVTMDHDPWPYVDVDTEADLELARAIDKFLRE